MQYVKYLLQEQKIKAYLSYLENAFRSLYRSCINIFNTVYN